MDAIAPTGRVQFGSERYAGGSSHAEVRVMSSMHFSVNDHDGLEGLPRPGLERSPLDPVPPLQV